MVSVVIAISIIVIEILNAIVCVKKGLKTRDAIVRDEATVIICTILTYVTITACKEVSVVEIIATSLCYAVLSRWIILGILKFKSGSE